MGCKFWSTVCLKYTYSNVGPTWKVKLVQILTFLLWSFINSPIISLYLCLQWYQWCVKMLRHILLWDKNTPTPVYWVTFKWLIKSLCVPCCENDIQNHTLVTKWAHIFTGLLFQAYSVWSRIHHSFEKKSCGESCYWCGLLSRFPFFLSFNTFYILISAPLPGKSCGAISTTKFKE